MTSLMASRGRLSWTASLIRYWYARLPRKLAPLVPRVARAVGDGAWAVVWVRMAAWAPVLVFVLAPSGVTFARTNSSLTRIFGSSENALAQFAGGESAWARGVSRSVHRHALPQFLEPVLDEDQLRRARVRAGLRPCL